ncbi:MAG: Ca-activated chloride channel [Betaproteobacteria bacterium]|jgi:Ca-activated chloride channel family protein|nr:Ca-activated chloride channel [Betaproteobacteria bacterium]
MTFLWPEMLAFFIVVPLLVAAYVLVLRKNRKTAIRYASLSLLKAAMPGRNLRRHVPPLLFLLAVMGMLLAVARPAAVISLPSQHDMVILAMDVSGSMRADDVKPTRLAAAQVAARAFVKDTPRTTRIGIVAFAGSAALVQTPTSDRDAINAAIDGLQLQNATAVGAGILTSLKAIFPEQEFDVRPPRALAIAAAGGTRPPQPQQPGAKPVPPGSYGSAAIILLTDGQTTTGPDPVDAARLAAERGVRVYTVGVGTPEGQILTGEGWSIRVRLDEDALKVVADLTRGEYFFAGNAPDLKKVYEMLTKRLVLEKKETEVTALFSAIAAAFALVSAALSLLWFNRLL